MDFVFTICDTAAAEECASWPTSRSPSLGFPDPVEATERDAAKVLAFAPTCATLRCRIEGSVGLPLASRNRISLKACADAIGIDIHAKG